MKKTDHAKNTDIHARRDGCRCTYSHTRLPAHCTVLEHTDELGFPS